MKILNLDISGMYSFKKAVWAPSDLNILIGPNGTGKSNLLRVLDMLSVCARGQLGRYVQSLGGISPLLWDGVATQTNLNLLTTAVEGNRPDGIDNLNYELILGQVGKGSTYRIEHELLGNYFGVRNGTRQEPFKMIERHPRQAVVFDENEKKLVAEEGIQEDETLLSLAAGPFTANKYVQKFQRQMADWVLYQDVNVGRDDTIRSPAVTRSESTVSSDGQNLVNVLHTLYSSKREFEREVNDAMKAAFGDEFEKLVFVPDADQRIQLKLRWKSLQREQPCSELSDGTLRFLFLLAVLGNPSPPPLIGIDEPELGLHPSMLPIVAEFAAEASTKTQVVLTTHSPELLNSFSDKNARITVVHHEEGSTILENVNEVLLAKWLESYTLGELSRSGELETVFKD